VIHVEYDDVLKLVETGCFLMVRNFIFSCGFLVCIGGACVSFAAPLSVNRAYVELTCMAREIEAFHDDTMIVVGSSKHTRDEARQVLDAGLNRAVALKEALSKMEFASGQKPVADVLASSLEALREFYQGLLDTPDDTRPLAERFKGFRVAYQEFRQQFVRSFPEYVAQYSPRGEWIIEGADEEVRTSLINALVAWEYGRAKDAFGMLKALIERPDEGAWRFNAMMKMADCLLHEVSLSQLDMESDKARATGLELLRRIVESGQYSPVLCGSYLRWRAAYQMLKVPDGGEVGARLPNGLYNQARRSVMLVLAKELESNPENYWAKYQLSTLGEAPNLNRTGGKFNTGYHEYAFFFGQKGGNHSGLASQQNEASEKSAEPPKTATVAGALMKAELERWQKVLDKWSDAEQRDKLMNLPVTRKLIDKIYKNIQTISVNPPVPGEYEVYSIPDGENALQRNIKLGKLVHNLIESRPADELGPYQAILFMFRELLVMDSVHIPYAIRSDDSRADFWYLLHGQLMAQLEQAMKQLPDSE
jgi:hypothetical protein